MGKLSFPQIQLIPHSKVSQVRKHHGQGTEEKGSAKGCCSLESPWPGSGSSDDLLISSPPAYSLSGTSKLLAASREQFKHCNKQLKSVKEDDRAWAAAALSNLVLDPGARAQLLSANVIELLCERLGDPKLEIAMEVAGALR